jgi:putative oxidoreductase
MIKLLDLLHMTQAFSTLRILAPGPIAAFIEAFEFLAGIFLIVGLFSRIAALGLVIDMTAACILADRAALFSLLSDPRKFSSVDLFIFLFVGLLILIFGPGKISVDALWGRSYATTS